MKAVVTGGAGFIGSHLSDELLKNGHEVILVDNLSSGSRENVKGPARLIQKDITKDELNADFKDIDAVFHFAADPDVRSSAENPKSSFDNNVIGTFRVLEACRKNDIKRFVFASTSTVYGEVNAIPTPETYPCEPISNYGASKLACEAYASSYSHTYGIRSTVLRYANIFGPRSNHGVMFDFFEKLKEDQKRLEILGNGKQEKSYLFVSDCIVATMAAFEKQQKVFDIYNVGSNEKHAVDEIANHVCRDLGLSPEFSYTGGNQGWAGDVKIMLLDVSKLRVLGWKPEIGLEKGVRSYLEWLKGVA